MDSKTVSAYRRFYLSRLLDDCVPFWLNSDLTDREYGGYITSVDRAGRAYSTDKSGWFQGRCLWTFSALCNRYGKKAEWLEAAETGADFIEKHISDTDGRMFFTLTRDGRPLRKRRYMFTESFYVMGMAEYGRVTGDPAFTEKAEKCFGMMLGIYRDPSSDPYKITPKSYGQTREERAAAVPMVLLSTAQLLARLDPDKSEYYTRTAEEIARDMIRFHWKPDLGCVLETVGADGSFIDNPSGRTVNPGHSMENSWFLMNLYLLNGDENLLSTALKILECSSELGWDGKFGGYLYFADINGRPPEQLEYDMKLWWVHCEAITAFLLAYSLTGDEKYFRMFERAHSYAFGHFSDNEFGEWYGYLHRDGTVSHTQKGSMWKGPFHYPRMLMNAERLLGKIEKGERADALL